MAGYKESPSVCEVSQQYVEAEETKSKTKLRDSVPERVCPALASSGPPSGPQLRGYGPLPSLMPMSSQKPLHIRSRLLGIPGLPITLSRNSIPSCDFEGYLHLVS